MKDIKKIANEIIRLEKEYELTSNSALEVKINKLIEGLTLAELMAIDDYILNTLN